MYVRGLMEFCRVLGFVFCLVDVRVWYQCCLESWKSYYETRDQNLWTFTDYSGFFQSTPQERSTSSSPSTRTPSTTSTIHHHPSSYSSPSQSSGGSPRPTSTSGNRMTVSSQSGPRAPRPPDDLIATATSALRRLHFKTGRNASKNTKQQVSGGRRKRHGGWASPGCHLWGISSRYKLGQLRKEAEYRIPQRNNLV